MMAAQRSPDPGRELAQLALTNNGYQPGAMLDEAIRYAFDQLCWHRTTPQLLALLDGLRASVEANEAA